MIFPQARHARAVSEEVDATFPKRLARAVHQRRNDGGIGVCEIASQEDGQRSIVDVERIPELTQADFIALSERDINGLERDVLQRFQKRYQLVVRCSMRYLSQALVAVLRDNGTRSHSESY